MLWGWLDEVFCDVYFGCGVNVVALDCWVVLVPTCVVWFAFELGLGFGRLGLLFVVCELCVCLVAITCLKFV